MKTCQTAEGRIYQLADKPFASGGEGELYEVLSDNSRVVKLYKDPQKVSGEKLRLLMNAGYQAVKMAAEKGDKTVIAWPMEIIEENRHPIGFVMHRFSGTKILAELFPNTELEWGKRVAIAANLCDVVKEVHSINQCIGDMNPLNFGVDEKDFVCMFDADSLHYNVGNGHWYPCMVGISEYFPPELQCITANGQDLRDLDPSQTFSRQSDLFALAVLIFQLLFYFHPFTCRCTSDLDSVVVNETRKNILEGYSPWFMKRVMLDIPLGASALDIIPEKLQLLFRRAFFENNRPEAMEWQQELRKLAHTVKAYPASWGPKTLPGSYRVEQKPQPEPKPIPERQPVPTPQPKSIPTPQPVSRPIPEPASVPIVRRPLYFFETIAIIAWMTVFFWGAACETAETHLMAIGRILGIGFLFYVFLLASQRNIPDNELNKALPLVYGLVCSLAYGVLILNFGNELFVFWERQRMNYNFNLIIILLVLFELGIFSELCERKGAHISKLRNGLGGFITWYHICFGAALFLGMLIEFVENSPDRTQTDTGIRMTLGLIMLVYGILGRNIGLKSKPKTPKEQ